MENADEAAKHLKTLKELLEKGVKPKPVPAGGKGKVEKLLAAKELEQNLAELAARQEAELARPSSMVEAAKAVKSPSFPASATEGEITTLPRINEKITKEFEGADEEALIMLDWLFNYKFDEVEHMVRIAYLASIDTSLPEDKRAGMKALYENSLKLFDRCGFKVQRLNSVTDQTSKIVLEKNRLTNVELQAFPENPAPIEKFWQEAKIVEHEGMFFLVLQCSLKDYWRRQPEPIGEFFQAMFEHECKIASDMPFRVVIPMAGNEVEIYRMIEKTAGAKADEIGKKMFVDKKLEPTDLTAAGLSQNWLQETFDVRERVVNARVHRKKRHGWTGTDNSLDVAQNYHLLKELVEAGIPAVGFYFCGMGYHQTMPEIFPEAVLNPEGDTGMFLGHYAKQMLAADDFLGMNRVFQIDSGHSMGGAAILLKKIEVRRRAKQFSDRLPPGVMEAEDAATAGVSTFVEGPPGATVWAGLTAHQLGLTREPRVVQPMVEKVSEIFFGAISVEEQTKPTGKIHWKTFADLREFPAVTASTVGLINARDPEGEALEEQFVREPATLMIVAKADRLCDDMRIINKLIKQKYPRLVLVFPGGHFSYLLEDYVQVMPLFEQLAVSLSADDLLSFMQSFRAVAPIGELPGIYAGFPETETSGYQTRRGRAPLPPVERKAGQDFEVWKAENRNKWQAEIEEHVIRFWPESIRENPELLEAALNFAIESYPFMFFAA